MMQRSRREAKDWGGLKSYALEMRASLLDEKFLKALLSRLDSGESPHKHCHDTLRREVRPT
jgi:hypothetical protein